VRAAGHTAAGPGDAAAGPGDAAAGDETTGDAAADAAAGDAAIRDAWCAAAKAAVTPAHPKGSAPRQRRRSPRVPLCRALGGVTTAFVYNCFCLRTWVGQRTHHLRLPLTFSWE
jgi:hypothetical protein